MSLWSRLGLMFRAAGWLGPYGAGDKALMDLFGGKPVSSGVKVDEAKALTSTAVWACVQLIAGTIGTLPLILYRRLPDGGRSRMTDNRLYRVLADSPNDDMAAPAFWETLAQHLLLWGNAFAEIRRDSRGQIAALWPIEPWRVTADRDGTRLRYRVDNDLILTPDEMLHIPGLTPDGVWGYSPIQKAREAVGLLLAAERFGGTFFGQGANFGGILTHPGRLNDAAETNLRASLEKRASGVDRAHNFIILQEGVTYSRIGIPPNDAQFLECVVPGTLFTMADGTRRAVESLRVDESVMAWDGVTPVTAKIAAIGRPAAKPLVRLRTNRGRELIASADHPILTMAVLRTLGGRPARLEPVWTPIGQLRPGQYVRVALGVMEEEVRPVLLSHAEAYFLGAMVGDGYIRRGGCSFSNADPEVLARLQTLMQSMGGHLKKAATRTYDWNVMTGGVGRGGSPIRRLLNLSGQVNRHSHEKTVPDIVTSAGPYAWRGFLAGYLDTDGCVVRRTKDPQPIVYWASTSLALLNGCQHLLALLGIQSAIYDMAPAGFKTIRGITCFGRHVYGLFVTGRSQVTKLAAALDLAHSGKRETLAASAGLSNSRYRQANWDYDRVTSVEPLGQGETIGVEIAGVHTHVTNGLVTHNTRQFQLGEIARFFGVPPHMIGDVERSTSWGTGIESQNIGFLTYTLRRWLVKIEKEVKRKLISPLEQNLQYPEFLVDALLRADTQTRYAAYHIGRNDGFLSANDIRRLENMDPLGDDGDMYFVAANMVPSDRVDELVDKQIASASARPTAAPPDPLPRDMEVLVAELRELKALPPPPPADLTPVLAKLDAAEQARQAQADRFAAMLPSVQLMIEDVARDFVRREGDRAKRAACSPEKLSAWIEDFYPKQSDYAVRMLRGAMQVYTQLVGRPDDTEREIRDRMAVYIRESCDALGAMVESPPEDLKTAVAGLVHRWEAERPAALARTLVAEVVAHV